MKAARNAQVNTDPPAHSGRYRRVRNAPSVASDVRLIDTQRQLTLAHQKLAELQDELHIMSDALELQRQCFDGILKEEKDRAQALVEEMKEKLARATQAHFETLSAMRRAYEKRLSDDPEAA